jgi:hypothetical protein
MAYTERHDPLRVEVNFLVGLAVLVLSWRTEGYGSLIDFHLRIIISQSLMPSEGSHSILLRYAISASSRSSLLGVVKYVRPILVSLLTLGGSGMKVNITEKCKLHWHPGRLSLLIRLRKPPTISGT